MARLDLDQPIVASVLDRLLDASPDLTVDPPKARGQYLREMRDSVRRDIENLLNTRQRCRGWPDGLGDLEQSLVNYGIPDFTGTDLSADERREEFRATIETVLRNYEPRFASVSVMMLTGDRLDRTLRFRIEALIRADPMPEPIVFDSYVDPATRSFAVVGAG
jgi:type VI secretion system protein ImpF